MIINEIIALFENNVIIQGITYDQSKGIGATPNNMNVDYLGLKVLMKASTFLELCPTLPDNTVERDKIKRLIDYFKYGNNITASPYLTIDLVRDKDDNLTGKGAQVFGHEGRHRVKAILEGYGDIDILVHLFFITKDSEVRNRHLTPEIINDINKQLIGQNRTNGHSYTIKTPIISGPIFKPL